LDKFKDGYDKIAAERTKELLVNYSMTFRSEAGTKVLEDLKVFCGYSGPCYVRGEFDHTAFNLGMRNVCLRIMTFLENQSLLKQEKQENAEDGCH
jgi:hypothetical protein